MARVDEKTGGLAKGAAPEEKTVAEERPAWRLMTPPQRAGRLVPFSPARKRTPIVLLAIPRSGVGSVARFMERIYGADGVTYDAGGLSEAIFARRMGPVTTDCVVANLPLVRWLHFAGASDFLRATVLRHPWARLASHINHLAEIGPERAGPPGSSLRALAEEVCRTDFTARSGVERFFNRLRLIDVSFDNIQVRMLVTGTMSALVKQVSSRDVEVALRELERFAVVGFCEEQLDMQRALARVTGAKVPVGAVFEGAGRGVALSVRNTVARDVLAPLFELDQELYTRARAMAQARQA